VHKDKLPFKGSQKGIFFLSENVPRDDLPKTLKYERKII